MIRKCRPVSRDGVLGRRGGLHPGPGVDPRREVNEPHGAVGPGPPDQRPRGKRVGVGVCRWLGAWKKCVVQKNLKIYSSER